MAEKVKTKARRESRESTRGEVGKCLACEADLGESETYRLYWVCHSCRFHYTLGAAERVALLADGDSFREINKRVASLDPLSFSSRTSYKQTLFKAQRHTGLREAAITGLCTIGETPVVLAVLDFGFLGGSMGCVVGEKIALAFEKAVEKKLPMVAVVSSSGTRLQEGVLSLMQMAKTAAAAKALHKAGLPFITVMTNPTTGQVYASFASLADIILAEPGALIGFAPLRLMAEAASRPLPRGSHTAEFHLEHGMLDGVMDRTRLRAVLSVLLALMTSQQGTAKREKRPKRLKAPSRPAESPWETVQLARHQERPSAMDYIGAMVSGFVELHGDRLYGDDMAVRCGLGYLKGHPVTVIAQERRGGDNGGRLLPEGFRKAQRVVALAAKFGLPVISLVDTPGAYEGIEAEERGIGHAIASTMATLSDLPSPVISVIIGQGGSEGALAFGVADRILMLENAFFSAISPEGAASLLYRDTSQAEKAASSLKLTAHDCKDMDIVDVIVPEPQGGAHLHPGEAARLLERSLLRQLIKVKGYPTQKLLKKRYNKLREMGEYSSYFRVTLAREVDVLQSYLSKRVSKLRATRKGAATAEGQKEG